MVQSREVGVQQSGGSFRSIDATRPTERITQNGTCTGPFPLRHLFIVPSRILAALCWHVYDGIDPRSPPNLFLPNQCWQRYIQIHHRGRLLHPTIPCTPPAVEHCPMEEASDQCYLRLHICDSRGKQLTYPTRAQPSRSAACRAASRATLPTPKKLGAVSSTRPS